MIYIQIFLPAILSLAAFLMMLKFGLNKSGIFIAALCAMAVYLLAESRVSFASAVNGTALTFVLIMRRFCWPAFIRGERKRRIMIDLLVVNGIYPDFEENCLKEANIGIQSGKITYIGLKGPRPSRSWTSPARWFHRGLSISICMKTT